MARSNREDSNPPREWDARSYHKVSEPQFEWGRRVLAALPLQGDETALDAGAGTGRLTSLLLDRLPSGRVVAVDRSVNMARVALEQLSTRPNAAVVTADLVRLPFARTFDVVFSTATFHWVKDHERLFAELFSVLNDGGRLHAQCGGAGNLTRIHRRALALADRDEFAPYFGDWKDPWEYASAEITSDRLARAGFRDIQTNVEESPVTFRDAEEFRAFITTVVMRTFLAKLPTDALKDAFLDRIVEQAATDSPAFTLDYWRLNISAIRG